MRGAQGCVAAKSKQRCANRRREECNGDDNRHSPSSVGDGEDEQEALPCPHVLFSHGSELFLSGRVED